MHFNIVQKTNWMMVLISILLACSPVKQETAPKETSSYVFRIKRGTNIAHWLSQSERRGTEREAFFTQKDLQFIKEAGFDHIRLPIDEVQMWDENGKRNEDAFALLERCLAWCKEEGLNMILDLHILRSHYFNADIKPLWTDPAEQDKLISMWKDLSAFAKKWPNEMLAYEFMNEPVADDAEQWNLLLSRVRDSIRRWEPHRTLVIGSNRWQSASTFDQLRVPANDRNIILSFHFYEPFLLTHVRAGWTHLKDFKGQVNYPGQIVPGGTEEEHLRVYDKDALEKMMAKPLKLADSLKLPLYCGEFGVINKAPVEDKLNWYRDIVALFNKHNVAYANWNFKAGSFGIVDEDLNPDEALINILVERELKEDTRR
jgi:endoglucanase